MYVIFSSSYELWILLQSNSPLVKITLAHFVLCKSSFVFPVSRDTKKSNIYISRILRWSAFASPHEIFPFASCLAIILSTFLAGELIFYSQHSIKDGCVARVNSRKIGLVHSTRIEIKFKHSKPTIHTECDCGKNWRLSTETLHFHIERDNINTVSVTTTLLMSVVKRDKLPIVFMQEKNV